MRIIRHIFYEEGEKCIMLSIKHLTKIYSGNKKAVDDISLDIQSGNLSHLLEPVEVVKQLL